MGRVQPKRAAGKNAVRRGFRVLNKGMVLAWRLGWGPWVNAWPAGTGRIMVLAHTGRASGLKRRTPLNYAVPDAGGDLYCVAGFGRGSDWYRNLKADPEVEVWLPDGWWSGTAEEVASDAEDRIFLLRKVLIASGFAAFLAGIDPYRTSDEDLARLAAGYRLIRIRRTAARTGPGGPGDLWWVWPAVALALLFRACRVRRRSRLSPRGPKDIRLSPPARRSDYGRHRSPAEPERPQHSPRRRCPCPARSSQAEGLACRRPKRIPKPR